MMSKPVSVGRDRSIPAGAVLGADVGGTKVAAGPVSRAGTLLAAPLIEVSRATDTVSLVTGLETTLRRAIAEFGGRDLKAIGLACAGTIDAERGVVVTSPNLPLENVPLAAILEDVLGAPVVLENDANAAVRAEAVAGAAIGLRDVVMLTLGTGVGGGLWLDGRVYRGVDGAAGELGHMIVRAGGEYCSCGAQGCFELYASGRALVRYASNRAGNPLADPDGTLAGLLDHGDLTGVMVSRLAREGHVGALEAVQELADWLGVGLVNIANIFNPEMIVIGGGVGELGELLLGPAREYLHENAIAPGRDHVKVVSAKLMNRAGLIGGGLAAWEFLDSHEPPVR